MLEPSKQRKQPKRDGIALITTLFVLTLVAGLTLLLFTRTMNEIKHSREGAEAIQTLMLARAGAVLGQDYVNQTNLDFRQDVQESISIATSGTSGPWYFGDGTGTTPQAGSVGKDRDMENLLTEMQKRFDTAFCGARVTPAGSVGTVELRVHVLPTACSGSGNSGLALPNRTKLPSPRYVSGPPRDGSGTTAVQTYSIPYVMVATGRQGEYERQMVVQGELHVSAGSSNFARYAYFTDQDAEQNLWFNTATMIDGPVHTNSNFRFDGTPWFGDNVTSAGCQDTACSSKRAGGYFEAFSPVFVTPDQTPSVGSTTPQFDGPSGVDWATDRVVLPKSTADQESAARGLRSKGSGRIPTQGIVIPSTTAACASSAEQCSLTMWAADATGTPLVYTGDAADGAPQWNTAAVYQYIEWCPTTVAAACTTYRTHEDTASGEIILERLDATGAVVDDVNGDGVVDSLDKRPFNGVIFSEVSVQRLTSAPRSDATKPKTAPPALAAFSQLTVASDLPIRITGDLKYEQPPRSGIATRDATGKVIPASDINSGATNILGIYSKQDLLIGHGNSADLNAPDNVMVHASLMSGQGSITVENFGNGVVSGDFQLIGGMIQTVRGAFGQFSGNTMLSGYNRTYTYDKRFLEGLSPPFFPTTSNEDGSEIYRFTFGVREQSN